ncbi:MAG: deoxyribose-phosphate aldolase [Sphaerochaeta sp.]
MNIASYIDHTVLAANATQDKIEKLCEEAAQWHFASVCVNTCWTALCAEKLKGTGVNVCSVVGFPLGAMSTQAKAFETKFAVDAGAAEIDMVINVGWLKNGQYDLVEEDIRKVKEACNGKLLKVIIETCLLTDEEKVKACQLSVKAGADYVKTSTGFSTGGAKVEDVALMRRTVGKNIGVKASGGIRTYEDAIKMINAGASRLGCSAGIAIVTAAK